MPRTVGDEPLSLLKPRGSTEGFELDIRECEGVYAPAEDTFLMLEHLTGMMSCHGSEVIPYNAIVGLELLHGVRERAGHWPTPAQVLDMGCGNFVAPKPNRLVILGGAPHMVARITPAAGAAVRASVSGFFLRERSDDGDEQ